MGSAVPFFALVPCADMTVRTALLLLATTGLSCQDLFFNPGGSWCNGTHATVCRGAWCARVADGNVPLTGMRRLVAARTQDALSPVCAHLRLHRMRTGVPKRAPAHTAALRFRVAAGRPATAACCQRRTATRGSAPLKRMHGSRPRGHRRRPAPCEIVKRHSRLSSRLPPAAGPRHGSCSSLRGRNGGHGSNVRRAAAAPPPPDRLPGRSPHLARAGGGGGCHTHVPLVHGAPHTANTFEPPPCGSRP